MLQKRSIFIFTVSLDTVVEIGDLADVTQEKEEDDAEEHEGDAAISTSTGLLLCVREDHDGRVGLHRPDHVVDVV